VKRYTERRSTRFEHAEEIRGFLTMRDFAGAEQELTAWVNAKAWTTGDGPKAIFNDAVAWLLNHRGAAARGHDPGPAGGSPATAGAPTKAPSCLG